MNELFRLFPPLRLVWLLVETVRGHRVRFMYTYEAGRKYNVGYISRFVSSPSDAPKLFGRAPGETVFVRYDPQAPGTSVVLAEDNPQ
jgi:hypothetical protein